MKTIGESRESRVEGWAVAPAQTAQERVLARVGTQPARLLALDPNEAADLKLLHLSCGVGSLALFLRDGTQNGYVEEMLRAVAAHCVGWVESNPGPIKDVFVAIRAERERQDGFLRTGKFTFTCASRIADPKRKFRVLLEEVGEVAKECDALEQTPRARNVWPFLREELIQVAAVCVAWLESYEVAA